MNTTQTLIPRLAWAVLAAFLFAVPLLISTATVEGFEDVKAAALSLAALTLSSLSLIGFFSAQGNGRRFSRQPLVIGVLLFALSALLSTVFSISPRTSWRGAYESHGGLLTIFGYVSLFFAAKRWGHGRKLMVGVVCAAVIASGYALLQAAGRDPLTWEGIAYFGVQPRPFATLGHANLLGAYLALSLPLLAYYALRSAQRRHWLLLGVLLVSAVPVLLALVLTLSRAAWLAAGCGLVLLLVSWCFGQARRGATALLVAVLVSSGLGALVLEEQWLPTSVQTALSQRWERFDDGVGRRDIWLAGWQIYRDHPVTGSGLDTFRLAFGTKRTAAYWDKEGEGTPVKAHNEVIHVLATQGTVGGLALCVLVLGLAWSTQQAWRLSADRPFIAALAASLTAFGVTNLFGFTVIGTGSVCAVCAGLLARYAQPALPLPAVGFAIPSWRRWAIPGVVLAAAVFAFLGVLEPLLANLACRRGDVVLAESPSQALTHYQEATELAPGCDLYWVRLADAAHREAQRTGSNAAIEQARTALERAASLVPVDAYHHANLARLLGELARTDPSVHNEAKADWQRAAALDPHNPYVLAEAARTSLVVGDYPSARGYAAQGVELYPKWAIFHAQLGAAALGEGQLPAASETLEAALQQDWRNDAEALSRTLAMLASAELRLQNFVKAQEFAGKASLWLPLWPTPHLMRAQALKALGQRDEATREIITARSLQGQPLTAANPR